MMHVIHVMRHYQDLLNQIDIDSNERQNATIDQKYKRAREIFELHENPLKLEFEEPYIYRIILRKDEVLEFYETPVMKGKLLSVRHVLDDTITHISENKNTQWWGIMIRMWHIIRSYPHSANKTHATNKTKI